MMALTLGGRRGPGLHRWCHGEWIRGFQRTVSKRVTRPMGACTSSDPAVPLGERLPGRYGASHLYRDIRSRDIYKSKKLERARRLRTWGLAQQTGSSERRGCSAEGALGAGGACASRRQTRGDPAQGTSESSSATSTRCELCLTSCCLHAGLAASVTAVSMRRARKVIFQKTLKWYRRSSANAIPERSSGAPPKMPVLSPLFPDVCAQGARLAHGTR